jgi:hypothetical protein
MTGVHRENCYHLPISPRCNINKQLITFIFQKKYQQRSRLHPLRRVHVCISVNIVLSIWEILVSDSSSHDEHRSSSPRPVKLCNRGGEFKYKPPNTPLLRYTVLLVLGQRTGAYRENCYRFPISPRWTRQCWQRFVFLSTLSSPSGRYWKVIAVLMISTGPLAQDQ